MGSLEQFEKVEAYISFSFFVVNDKVPAVSSNNKLLIHWAGSPLDEFYV